MTVIPSPYTAGVITSLAPSGDTTGALDTARINTAIAGLGGGGTVLLGPGTFWINATVTVTTNGIILQGEGAYATTVKAVSGMTATTMIQFGNGSVTIADCGVRDLMLDSAVQKTGGYAVDVNKGLRTRLQNLRIYHQYNSVHVHNSTITWLENSDLRDQSNNGVDYDSDLGAGFDLYINNVISDNPVVSNSGTGLNWTGGENLVVNNCDFLHYVTGLLVNPGSGRQCRWGFLSTAEFDTCSDNCWKLTNAAGDIAGLTFTNCWAGTATNYGVLIDGSGGGGILQGIRLEACKIVHNGLAGVRLISSAAQVSVTDCDIISNSQTVSNTRSGIEVTAGTTDFVIAGCQITNGLGQGSTQSNAINFDAGATNHFVITDNDLRGNANTSINGLGGVTGTDGKVRDNLGFTVAASNSTAGTSPFTFPVLTYDAVYVITTVGGMTALTLDAQALFNASFSVGQQVYVASGHTLIATWATTAPVFRILPTA